jgi:molybdopterin-guanine dinucleotide biosynthesis protein A
MTAALLSGGRGKRFPYPKGLIDIGGNKLIEINLNLLSDLAEDVFISTNTPELYFHMGFPVVGDLVSPSGPMSGIFSVLFSSEAPEVFVTACDMPYIKKELMTYIIKNRAAQATVPVFRGRPEPMLAVYSRELLNIMEELIREGKSSLTHMLDEVDVNYIEEEDIRKIDREGRSFININTPEDYERETGSRFTIDRPQPQSEPLPLNRAKED